MINIQINERVLYKITSQIPKSFPIPDKHKNKLKEISVEFEGISVQKHQQVNLDLNVKLSELKIVFKLFKIKLPIFKVSKSTGNVRLKFFLFFDKKHRNLILIPYIVKAKLKKIPKPLLFIAKIIFNIFLSIKSRVHIKIEDIPLEGISLKRSIVIEDIKTHTNNINLIGHLDNHPPDEKVPEIEDKSLLDIHKDKDVIVLLNTKMLEEIFFEILPKFYSTGMMGVPEVEFTGADVELFDNNRAKLRFKGHLMDARKNPFEVSLKASVNYIRNKKHIQISKTVIEKIEIENTAYSSLKNIIEIL